MSQQLSLTLEERIRYALNDIDRELVRLRRRVSSGKVGAASLNGIVATLEDCAGTLLECRGALEAYRRCAMGNRTDDAMQKGRDAVQEGRPE